MTEATEKTQPVPLSPTDLLKAAVAEEIAALHNEEQEARAEGHRGEIVGIIEARARLKLEVAATALRVEANLRRMLAGAPAPEMTEKALGALAKLRGGSRPGPNAGDAQ